MVTAPYNFVPLAAKICTAEDLSPDLAKKPAQDMPETNSQSGVLDLTITCKTPLLIGDGGEEIHFVKAPGEDGTPQIPGSSLRGMIRNVLEIASFGRMQFVDDHRIGVRDLTAPLDYTSRLGGVQAGWLRIDSDENGQPCLKLSKCSFAHISHDELDNLSRGFKVKITRLAQQNSPDDRGAQQVQEAFSGSHCGTFRIEDGEFGRKLAFADAGGHAGALVFTGLPGPSKKHEFVFYGNGEKCILPSEAWQRFIAVHEEQEKESKTWKWRKAQLYKGHSIPVFWLPDADDTPAHIGLAMMFKIAADNSIGDLLDNTNPDHRDDTRLDLPSRMFGQVADGNTSQASGFRTRISFGWAGLEGTPPEPAKHTVIAARPKPSFVPSYVRQRDFADTSGKQLLHWENQRPGGNTTTQKAQYRSYMNWPAQNPVREELRGWKRYPVRPAQTQFKPATGDATSTLHPLPGSHDNPLEFRGKIRYHNLHPIELGALIWALTWGGNKGLRHSLGMGRPYGWGQVQISVNGQADKAQKPFTDAMERAIPGWANSPQIRQLLAMANPEIGEKNTGMLQQMKLDPTGGVNEFNDAKKARQVLPEYLPDDMESPLKPGGKTSAKGYAPPNRHQGQRPRARAPQPPTGPLQVGSRVYCEGEEAIIIAMNGNSLTVEFDPDDTMDTTIDRVIPRA